MVFYKLGSAGGYHNRVNYDIFCLIEGQLSCDYLNKSARSYHADFDCIRKDICKNTVQLFFKKVRTCLHNVCYAGSILGSKSRDCAHGVYAMGSHSLDICLDAGASAGIRASDC